MKKIKTTVSILALVALTILNFTHAYKGYGTSLQMVLAAGLGSGGSGGSGGTSGTGGDSSDCCSAWGKFWGNCNQEREETRTDIFCKTTTTSYFDAYGNLVGTMVIKFGKVQSSYGGAFSYKTVSEKTHTIPNTTIITCPTRGKCDNCTEYTPPCE